MNVDIEYAIKQDIRNNPVVREIDRQQKKEFLQMLGLATLLVGSLLFSAVPKMYLLSNGYEVEGLRQTLAEEEARQRTLRLELEQRLSPGVLEERARGELGMVFPTAENTVIIERVTTSVPARGIVARADGRQE